MFSITYKQKNTHFHKLFPSIDTNEKLLVDYSCALQKDTLLIQGKLYICQKFICFHANILGWETNLQIEVGNIRSIKKATTIKFIPNAIILELKSELMEKEDKDKCKEGTAASEALPLTPQNSHDPNLNDPISSQPSDTNLTQSSDDHDKSDPNTRDPDLSIKFTSFLDRNAPFNVIYNLLQVYNAGSNDILRMQALEKNSTLWALVLKRYHNSANELANLLEKSGWQKPKVMQRAQSAKDVSNLTEDDAVKLSESLQVPKLKSKNSSNNNVISPEKVRENFDNQTLKNAKKLRHKSENYLSTTTNNSRFVSAGSSSKPITPSTPTEFGIDIARSLQDVSLVNTTNQDNTLDVSMMTGNITTTNEEEEENSTSFFSEADDENRESPSVQSTPVDPKNKKSTTIRPILPNHPNQLEYQKINVKDLISTVPLKIFGPQINKYDFDKVIDHDIDLIYRCLFDETSRFQQNFMPIVEKLFKSGTEFKTVQNDPNHPNSNCSKTKIDDFSTGMAEFSEISLDYIHDARNREFTQQISTPLINKLVINKETTNRHLTKINFNTSDHQIRELKIYEIDQTANTPNVPYGSSFNVIIKTCLTPLVIQVSKSNNNKNKISHSVLSTKVQVEIKIDFIKRTLGKSLVEGPAKKGCLEYWSKMLKHLDNFIEKQKELSDETLPLVSENFEIRKSVRPTNLRLERQDSKIVKAKGENKNKRTDMNKLTVNVEASDETSSSKSGSAVTGRRSQSNNPSLPTYSRACSSIGNNETLPRNDDTINDQNTNQDLNNNFENKAELFENFITALQKIFIDQNTGNLNFTKIFLTTILLLSIYNIYCHSIILAKIQTQMQELQQQMSSNNQRIEINDSINSNSNSNNNNNIQNSCCFNNFNHQMCHYKNKDKEGFSLFTDQGDYINIDLDYYKKLVGIEQKYIEILEGFKNNDDDENHRN